MKYATVALFVLLAALVGCSADDANSKKSAPTGQSKGTPKKKAVPLIPKTEILDWCKEHGVPESICTRCDESLVSGYKQRGDWCDDHGLPDSQCFECHPELEAKFKETRPQRGK
jgi:hypothetical protein